MNTAGLIVKRNLGDSTREFAPDADVHAIDHRDDHNPRKESCEAGENGTHRLGYDPGSDAGNFRLTPSLRRWRSCDFGSAAAQNCHGI